MTSRLLAIGSAFLASVLAAPVAADESEMTKALASLGDGTPFELTLSIPETGETFHRENTQDPFLGLAFRACLSPDGRGAIRAVIRLPETDKPMTLRTVGLAEDFYLVYALKLEKPFARWLDKARTADSPDVVVDQDENLTSRTGDHVDPVPTEYLQAVAAAAVKYEEKRPELVLRARRGASRSRLFFPPAAKTGWGVRREGDRLVVTAVCVDRMFVALFDVEFRKVAGSWEYVRIHAREEFKGE